MQKKIKNLFQKIFLGIIAVLFFQNCSNVNLAYDEKLSERAAFVSGKICYSGSARGNSLYKLVDLYVINLNAKFENGSLKSDSDMNSIADSDEEALNRDGSLATVMVSSKDTDSDGVPDFIEKLKGFSVNKDEMNIDGYDGDGVINRQELQRGTDPLSYDRDIKNIEYDVSVDSTESSHTSISDCGIDQFIYKVDISTIRLTSSTDFVDTVNIKNSSFILSHKKDENVVLIMYRLRSENVNNPDLFYGHLLKLKLGEPVSYVLGPKDFYLFPN